jgi:hypothetical protein
MHSQIKTVSATALSTSYSTFTSTSTVRTLTVVTANTPITTTTVYTPTSTVSDVATATACGNALADPGFETYPYNPPWNVTGLDINFFQSFQGSNINGGCHNDVGTCL